MPTETAIADRSRTRSLPRWVLWLPSIALIIAFGAKALASPNAVRDVFSGTQAFVITALLVAAWALLAFVLLPRLIRNEWWRLGVLSAVAVIAIVVLVVPSFRDDKVVEAFPTVTAPAVADVPVADADPQDAAPVQIGAAALTGIDHDATGTATISRQPDGSFVVGLEEIDIEPGPDYFVYVVSGVAQDAPGDGIRLDSLKGNEGTQFYPVPSGTDLGVGEWTVLVWCRAFAVPIANATPTSA